MEMEFTLMMLKIRKHKKYNWLLVTCVVSKEDIDIGYCMKFCGMGIRLRNSKDMFNCNWNKMMEKKEE